MNHVFIMGRLSRDPEVKYSEGEKPMAVAKYTLAVDRRGRRNQDSNEQTADFINCVAFDRTGEFAEKYFRQGMRVLVSGRIQTGSYTNKDGVRVYTFNIVVNDQEFADSKNASSDNSRPDPSSSTGDGFMNIPEGVEDQVHLIAKSAT
jgi:single-strand DNA-binding protein